MTREFKKGQFMSIPHYQMHLSQNVTQDEAQPNVHTICDGSSLRRQERRLLALDLVYDSL